METLLTSEILDLLRKIGDPLVDRRVDVISRRKGSDKNLRRVTDEARKKGLVELMGPWLTANARDFGVNDFFVPPRSTLPDPDLVKTACDLFARYGSEIAAALLLAALPEAYAAGEGAKVLAQHSELAEGGALSTRRILATAQFVIWILTPDNRDLPLDKDKYAYPSFDDTRRLWEAPDGQALRASLALRVMHSLIRSKIPTSRPIGIQDPPWQPPRSMLLNQEDLLATLLSFSITVFDVLEQFGIHWTAKEQEAYFYVWDRVGETLGIGDESVIQALTGLPDLKELKKTLHAIDVGASDPQRDLPDPARRPGSQVTRRDRVKLFNGLLNRQVLRRVADVGNLRPQSVQEARALLVRLRERLWTLDKDCFPQREAFTYENFKQVLDDVSPGRILLKAMVDEVADRLPASEKTLPIAVIRQLVPPQVQNRLALGGTSSVGFLGGLVGTPRDLPGSVGLAWVSAKVLRQRATRVSNALFLDYYDHGKLEIPGLLSTAVGYGVQH